MNEVLTIEQADELIASELAIFVVKTKTCSVCVPIEARLKDLLSKYENVNYHVVYQENLPEFGGQHLIFTVPTILFFSKGKEMLREARFVDFHKVERMLEIILG